MSGLALTVNGTVRASAMPPRTSLADYLRDGLDLTGTHLGCEHGVCGACTVLIDGVPARSCITLAAACEGASVTTIEGLDADPVATELRAAFSRHHALQCGYCTPGMMVSARDLVLRLPEADDRSVREGLAGNLCRCTGYAGIVAAVTEVIAIRRAAGTLPSSTACHRALGPTGAPTAERATGTMSPPTASVAAPSTSLPRPTPATIADFIPAHTFTLSVVLPYGVEETVALFDDVGRVAAAIPGCVLTEAGPDHAAGSLVVALGPVRARFSGQARIMRDDTLPGGRILAAGADAASRSQARGSIDYGVAPGPDASHAVVDLSIGYALSGLLAQVGRPGLVQSLAAEILARFAENLSRSTTGAHTGSDARQAKPLSLAGLLWSVLRGALGINRHRGEDSPK